ncbi:hypothetical protein [Saccharolobus islandicus]|uniref:hypothetical protein n=1 Tax=Saccharolobus islandicus TaxID=43080 RepID=UPI00064FEA02|nr:hypothetical protein [Sulfolobus islandicus]
MKLLSTLDTKKERYLNVALESFYKSEGDVKVKIGTYFMSLLDKPDILFNIINEILSEGGLIFYSDKITETLGIAYANIKDDRILELMNNAPFYHYVLDFILNMTGQSLSKRLKISLSFW